MVSPAACALDARAPSTTAERIIARDQGVRSRLLKPSNESRETVGENVGGPAHFLPHLPTSRHRHVHEPKLERRKHLSRNSMMQNELGKSAERGS